MSTIFLTGFPGFLGKEIVPRILKRDESAKVICLVQDRFMNQAKQAVKALDKREPEIGLKERVKLVEGDITDPQLGLGEKYKKYTKKVEEVYHFAAVYDLDVARDFAYKVNVIGTQHILDFCKKCKKLTRHHYVSTCYVSGRYEGRFTENHLEEGQSFNNFYEETKYLAEVLVKNSMDDIPTTIYRPAIVTGDSTTGATQKYDGPYFILRWIMRNPQVAVFPTLGNPNAHTMNIVPRDFVVNAIAALSGMKKSLGKTYNLADPRPLTISQMADTMGSVLNKNVIKVPLFMDADQAVWLLKRLPIITDFMEIPTKAICYFAHPTSYDTKQSSKDLKKVGISCPSYDAYLPNLVDFIKKHPEVSSAAMV